MEKERRKAIRAAKQRQREAKKKSVSFNVRILFIGLNLMMFLHRKEYRNKAIQVESNLFFKKNAHMV